MEATTEETVLVAGGAGFLGCHLCDSLAQDGINVICVDNFSSGQRDNVAHLVDEANFKLIEGDICNNLTLPPVDRIYDLASRASPEDFTEHPVEIALTNSTGTRHLLNHAVACDARAVFASTSEVYGDPEVNPQPESYTGNVNIRGPRGCYNESKRFGETLTVAYAREYGLDVRTARIFNTYGPRMRANDGRVIPTFITQALTDNPLTVYGDGSQTRSFCYVSDMIDGLRSLMKVDGLSGEVANLGKQNEIEIRALAKRIRSLCGADSEIINEPLPEDDPTCRQPDLKKAREILDWCPSITLTDGLERTIAYFA